MLKMDSIRQLIKYFVVSKIKRYFYRIFIYLPLPFSFYQTLEFLSSTALGKGWGCETIQDEVKLCLSLLGKTPRILIDIGAHRGEYTNCVITKFPKLKAYLFEPSKYNYELLKKKYEGQKNIIIENFALSNFTPAGAVSISGYVGLFEWHVVQRSFRIAWTSSYVNFFS